jgi:hypothetical protein
MMYNYDRRPPLRVASMHHQKYEEALRLLGFPSGSRPSEHMVEDQTQRFQTKCRRTGEDVIPYLDASYVLRFEIPEVLEEKDREKELQRKREEQWLEKQIEINRREQERERAERERARARARELAPEQRQREKARKQGLPGDLRHEKYPDARARILNELPQHGWTVKPNLKVPWAKRRNDRDNTVWFKAQAVYLNDHSLFLDIRGMPTREFIKRVETQMDQR